MESRMSSKEMKSAVDQVHSSTSSSGRETVTNTTAFRENSDEPLANVSKEEVSQLPTGNGEDKFQKLSWQRMTVCLIVEAIAIGTLSIPSAFRTLGMVLGICLTVALGLVSIYTSKIIGSVAVRYAGINHYADAVGLMCQRFGPIWKRIGIEVTSIMFILVLILINGSHVLTGTIAFSVVTDHPPYLCALVFGGISAFLLFVFALPTSFHKFSILGYIDLASILAAVLIIIIATGIEGHSPNAPPPTWSLWPAKDTTFEDAFLSAANIIFAYSFSMCQLSFMAEMHTPKDFMKSIWTLGLFEIVIYTVTGATIYSFTGSSTQSPALLSAPKTISRIAFGVAFPVIFISGSINITVLGRYVLDRYFAEKPQIRHIRNWTGKAIWVGIIFVATAIGWAIAEAVPVFNALLGLVSSLFISGFCYYFPALFWFLLLKEGRWYSSWKNIGLSLVNTVILCMGIALLICGTYSCVLDIMEKLNSGQNKGSFTCSSAAYGV